MSVEKEYGETVIFRALAEHKAVDVTIGNEASNVVFVSYDRKSARLVDSHVPQDTQRGCMYGNTVGVVLHNNEGDAYSVKTAVGTAF